MNDINKIFESKSKRNLRFLIRKLIVLDIKENKLKRNLEILNSISYENKI